MRTTVRFVCVLLCSVLGVAHAEHSSTQWKKSMWRPVFIPCATAEA